MRVAHASHASLACLCMSLSLSSPLFVSEAAAVDRLVPSQHLTIQAAIDSAEAGVDRVVVVNASQNPYAAFTLNKNVPVLTTSSQEIIVQAGGSDAWAVRITEAGGSVDGLTIRSRSNGTGAVEMTCDSDLTNCKVQDNGNAFTGDLVTITSAGAGAKVSDCTFRITSTGNHGAAIAVYASTSGARTEILDNTLAHYVGSGCSAAAIDLRGATSAPLLQGNVVTVTGANQLNVAGILSAVGVERGTPG